METIKLEGLDICCYKDKLKNGLEMVFVPYKDKKNYFISYATRFGSEITSFVPIESKKEIKVPDGIAHFLEHKMFEQENGVDPFTFFSESGTGANASTSYDNTQYICYGTKDFEKNLKFLLKFVNEPYFTDENVEKEKGIISEELKMYEDIPEIKLEMKLRENIYHIHPRRVDIGGTIEEINKIEKEDLYTCYKNFYSPNNMFILIVGNFDQEKAREIIEEEIGKKKSIPFPKIKKIKEQSTINKSYEKIESNVRVPKIGMGIKIPKKNLGNYDELTLDLYLSMISTVCFGSSSTFRERVRNKKLLNSFYTEWETTDDFKTLYMIAVSDNLDQFLEEVKKEFSQLTIEESSFERMKKVWIANEVKMIDYIDSTVHNIYDDYLHYHMVVPNKIERIRKLNIKEIQKIAKQIDFNNMAVVIQVPKEKEE